MFKKLQSTILISVLFFSSILCAQTLTITPNGATEVSLQGGLGSGVTQIDVTITLADAPDTFTGSTFLNLYPPTGATTNATRLRSSDLSAATATSVPGSGAGLVNLTWEIQFLDTERNAGLTSADIGMSGYRLQARIFNINGPGTGSNVNSGFSLFTVVDEPVLAVKDFKKDKEISFSPNPVTNIITLGDEVVSESYKVIDLSGSTIKEVKGNSNQISVVELSAGVYFLVSDFGVAKFVKN